jgi:hypothetical protein
MTDVDAYMAFRQAAESALERAHEAALEANGCELRQGLEDALTGLADASPLSPNRKTLERLRRSERLTRQALTDFDAGKLVELVVLLETARKEISCYDLPDD